MKNSFLKKNLHIQCHPLENFVWVFNIVSILILIPLLDQCLYPCLQGRGPNMLKRIGMGYLLLIISAVVLCTYEGIQRNADCMFEDHASSKNYLSSWLVLLPGLTVAIAEVCVNVTGMLHNENNN